MTDDGADKAKGLVEAVGQADVEALEQVPVDVEGGGDRGVAQSLLDDLGMLASGHEQCHVSVSPRAMSSAT